MTASSLTGLLHTAVAVARHDGAPVLQHAADELATTPTSFGAARADIATRRERVIQELLERRAYEDLRGS